MATSTLSVFSNTTKPKFNEAVLQFINKEKPLLEFLKPGNIPYDGEDYFYIPYQDALPEGGAWTVENADVPASLDVNFLKPYLTWKKYVHTIDLSQETIDLTKGANAIKAGLQTYTTGALDAVSLNMDAALHGDGTGALAKCVSYSGQVVTVDSTKFIRKGMVLDGYDSSDNHDADGIVVTAINSDTTFTCTGTVTSVDSGTVLYNEGSWVTGLDRAANGIDNIIDDDSGTFQGLSRSTYPDMKALVTDGDTPGTNQALTQARMRTVTQNIAKGPYAKLPDWVYCSMGVHNAYFDLLVATNQPTEVLPTKGGKPGGLHFYSEGKDIPLFGSYKAAPNTMFFLSKGHIFKYFGKMGWFNHGGGMLKSMQSTGKLAVRANYTAYLNFGTDFPSAFGRLNDITET